MEKRLVVREDFEEQLEQANTLVPIRYAPPPDVAADADTIAPAESDGSDPAPSP